MREWRGEDRAGGGKGGRGCPEGSRGGGGRWGGGGVSVCVHVCLREREIHIGDSKKERER